MRYLKLLWALARVHMPGWIVLYFYDAALPVAQGRRADPKAAAVADLVGLVRDPNLPPSVEESRVQMADFVARFDRPETQVDRRDLTLPGAAAERPARLYRPLEAPEGALPTLLYFHGGGWVQGGLDTHDHLCAKLARRAGIQVISYSYRLAPEHPFPAAPDDVLVAYQTLFKQAEALRVDVDRIAVGGDSAGGNLTASLLYTLSVEERRMPAGQLLFYPAVDARLTAKSVQALARHPLLSRARMEGYLGLYLPADQDRLAPRVSPLFAPRLAGQPPAFVLVAGHDPLWDDGQAYAARLKADGVPVELCEFSGQVHGFLNLTKVIPEGDLAISKAAGWLHRTLCK